LFRRDGDDADAEAFEEGEEFAPGFADERVGEEVAVADEQAKGDRATAPGVHCERMSYE
jgi:hypothetical protein